MSNSTTKAPVIAITEHDRKCVNQAQEAWDKYMKTEPGSPEWKDADLQWATTATMLAHMYFSKVAQAEVTQ